MEEKLKSTITKLQTTFRENGLNFDGQPKNFWQMLNDPDIQKAIVFTMNKKIEEARKEKESLSIALGFAGSPAQFLRDKGH